MLKRKREDEVQKAGHSAEDDRALNIKKSRLKAKIDQGNHDLHAALKLARGFERQKLGRRQKTAKSDAKTLLKLKEEVIALKALELTKTAESHLFKQLAKTKRIKESPAFVSIYGRDPKVEAPKPGAEANVMGRLFNSNPLKEVLPGVMKGIYSCLGIQEAALPDKARANEVKNSKTAHKTPPEPEEDDFDGFSSQEAPTRVGHTAPENDLSDSNEGDMTQYDDRLASESGLDSDDDSMSSGDDESIASTDFILKPQSDLKPEYRNRALPNQALKIKTQSTRDLSLSPSPPPPSKPAKSAKAPASTTTILPSLMMGGYISGSDSDFDGRAPQELQPARKNRRGQRARQEIAEKKYGSRAKHLQKAKAEGRDSGWDARRGATERGERKGKDSYVKGGRGPRSSGANDEALGMRGRRPPDGVKKDDSGPLHPSWEAAKKRKEAGSKSAAVTPTGKKVTFD